MKKKIELVTFDLDGTLCESSYTIYQTTIETLQEFGIENNIKYEEFKQHIGKHFKDIFNFYQIEIPNLEEYIIAYKKRYYDYLPYTRLYPRVKETLEALKIRGKKIALLSTKSQDQCEKIIRFFQLDIYFDIIKGRIPGEEYKPSPLPLLNISQNLSIPITKTIIVGDTELDILCGKNAGAYACAVLYGYRNAEHLRKYEPDFQIEELTELLQIID